MTIAIKTLDGAIAKKMTEAEALLHVIKFSADREAAGAAEDDLEALSDEVEAMSDELFELRRAAGIHPGYVAR